MNYAIKTESAKQLENVLTLLFTHGYRSKDTKEWENNQEALNDWVKGGFEQEFKAYPVVIFKTDTRLVDGIALQYEGNASETSLTMDEFMSLNLGKTRSVTVKLNDEYDAVVSKDTIVVGCQEFSVDVLKKLNEAHASLL